MFIIISIIIIIVIIIIIINYLIITGALFVISEKWKNCVSRCKEGAFTPPNQQMVVVEHQIILVTACCLLLWWFFRLLDCAPLSCASLCSLDELLKAEIVRLRQELKEAEVLVAHACFTVLCVRACVRACVCVHVIQFLICDERFTKLKSSKELMRYLLLWLRN